MKWKVASVAALLLAGVAAGLCFYRPFAAPPALVLPGVVEIQEVRLGSRVAGRVVEVCVAEGDLAEPGQVLLRLEAAEREAQREVWRAQVRAAEAELEKARNGPRAEEVEAAEAVVATLQARVDRLTAGNRQEEVRQAQAEWETARADEKLADEDYDRAVRLLRTGAMARTEFDALRAALDRHRGRVATARARFDLMKAGSREEEIAEARADLRRARANLRLLQAGTRSEDLAAAGARLAEAQGRLREAEVLLRETTVRAPERAVVEVVAVRPGDLVEANQAVLRVLRASDLWVKIYVPETDLGKVRPGQEVSLTVDSFPGRRFAGKVVHIGSESEFTPRNVQSVDDRRHQVFGVRVRVEDPGGVFKSGMAAEVTVPTQE